MLRKYAKYFGIGFIVIGILGFIPGFTMDNNLLGIFHVNALHNLIHLVTGVIAIWASNKSLGAAQKFFQIFGVIYLAVAVLGFAHGDRPIFAMIANNMADSILHLVLGALFLYWGFKHKLK